MKENLRICCCYAHTDRPLLEGLKRYLHPLQKAGLINIWTDANISPGSDWEKEIRDQLQAAQIILLLVSADFLHSDYCYSKEMQYALERHHTKQARTIPIILRPSLWTTTPLANLQALPKYAIPVMSNSWSSQDEAFSDIAEGLRQVIEELSSNIQKPLSSESLAETAIAYRNVPRAVTNAVLALDSIDQEQRYQGLYTLQMMTHPAAQEALVGALNHPHREVRMQAARILKHDHRAIPVLVEMLYPYNNIPFFKEGAYYEATFQGEADQLRALAIDALCQMGEPAMLPLIEALNNDDDQVRTKAAEALGALHNKQAVLPLTQALLDSSYEVRIAAAEALASLQDKQAVLPLTQALLDPSYDVLVNSRYDHISPFDPSYTIQEKVHIAIIQALSNLQDKQAVPPLLKALYDPNYKKREATCIAIIQALGNLQDKQAVPSLVEVLQDSSLSYAVRSATQIALENLGEQIAPPSNGLGIPPPPSGNRWLPPLS